MMDNRLFNVNGSGRDALLAALRLAFQQNGLLKAKGWEQTKENGLIICWTGDADNIIPFPSDLDADACLPFIQNWLQGKFSADVEYSEWCDNFDHDGHNSEGWQVYVDECGHVGANRYAICAIKRAYCWHGK
jgi:hypothetical protein